MNTHALKILDALAPLLVRSHGFSASLIASEYREPIVDNDRVCIEIRREFCRGRARDVAAQFAGTVVEQNGGSSDAMAWHVLAEILDLALEER